LETRRGLVTGIILAGFGFGSFVFSFMALDIVNPDNAKPDKLPDGNIVYSPEIAERVPALMRALAVCFGILGIVAMILVKKNPDFVIQELDTEGQLTVSQALRHRSFWLICIQDYFSIYSMFYLSSVFKTIGLQLGDIDDLTLTWIGSLASVANGLSRIVWGVL